jgi:hypothetical protein
MNWKHLLYIIPLCLVLGFIFGFYINIPKHITIDTGENLKNLSIVMQNITHNYESICKDLTYKCECDTYDMIDLNKKIRMIQAYTLDEWRNKCTDVSILTYACMNRQMFRNLDITCEDLYSVWGNSTT